MEGGKMKYLLTIYSILFISLLVSCGGTRPTKPPEDKSVDFAILVSDQNNNPVDSARVYVSWGDLTGWFIQQTTAVGATQSIHITLNSRVVAVVQKLSYVTSVDTFVINSWTLEPQYGIVNVSPDTGYSTAQIRFHVIDTAGASIRNAKLRPTWFPGPNWDSPISAGFPTSFMFNRDWEWLTTDSAGATDSLDIHIDPLRNFIAAEAKSDDYQIVVDTFVVTINQLNEFIVILKSQ